MSSINCPICNQKSIKIECSSSTNFQEYLLECGSKFFEAIDFKFEQDFGLSESCNLVNHISSQKLASTMSEIKRSFVADLPIKKPTIILEQSEQIFEG